MARQPDGKVLVAGSIVTEGSRKAAVVRFTAGGQPDPSFGAGGLILVQGVTSFTAAAVRPDGRILLAGENGASLFVIRLMPGGALDSAFGSDGSVRYNGTISPFTCQDIAIQPNGKILLATTSGSTGGPRAYAAVLRLTSVGALDTTFAGSGYVFANLSTTIDTSEAVAIQPDGKILSAGTSADRSYVFRLAGDAPWVSPLPAWRQTNFGTMNNSGLAANDADPDQDGVTNLMEYAFNLNPNSAASRSIPAFVTTASGISIAYTHPDPAGTKLLNIAVEATLDPASNSWAPRPDENPSASVFSASLSFANGPHAFLRLRVTEGSGP